MQYRKLGRSGVLVSEVSLGGWLTHGRSIDDSTTSSIVHRAFDLGINFFDTADVYNQGEAEKSLAVAVKDLRRNDLFIATKCFFPRSEAPNDRGLSRKHITESVHDSLDRLNTDRIDLYQFHRHDPSTPVEETVAAIGDLIKQGKVVYWGVSMWPAWAIVSACHIAKELGVTSPVSNQPRYNMLDRGIEKSVIPASELYGVSQVVFSPLAQGVLTGKYKPGQAAPTGSRGADDKSNMFMADDMEERRLQAVQEVAKIAEKAGVSMTRFALAWCLRQPNIASVIVGATSVEQLEENAGATGLSIDPALFDEADALFGKVTG